MKQKLAINFFFFFTEGFTLLFSGIVTCSVPLCLPENYLHPLCLPGGWGVRGGGSCWNLMLGLFSIFLHKLVPSAALALCP